MSQHTSMCVECIYRKWKDAYENEVLHHNTLNFITTPTSL